MRLVAMIVLGLLLCVYHARAEVSSGKESVASQSVASGRIELRRHARVAASVEYTSQIVSHPPGCPRRAFCGCGAALEVFGRHVRGLWLARNWFQFPRTTPAPGMVAVRRNHVFVIREVRGPNLVLAYDANSGQRKTRIHVRSLNGFVVVNPHARRWASAG